MQEQAWSSHTWARLSCPQNSGVRCSHRWTLSGSLNLQPEMCLGELVAIAVLREFATLALLPVVP